VKPLATTIEASRRRIPKKLPIGNPNMASRAVTRVSKRSESLRILQLPLCESVTQLDIRLRLAYLLRLAFNGVSAKFIGMLVGSYYYDARRPYMHERRGRLSQHRRKPSFCNTQNHPDACHFNCITKIEILEMRSARLGQCR